MTKVEHDELKIGDVIELADEPATVLDVVPWVGGCSRVAIERPLVGTSAPGARDRGAAGAGGRARVAGWVAGSRVCLERCAPSGGVRSVRAGAGRRVAVAVLEVWES
jgi:hypothetical protein